MSLGVSSSDFIKDGGLSGGAGGMDKGSASGLGRDVTGGNRFLILLGAASSGAYRVKFI